MIDQPPQTPAESPTLDKRSNTGIIVLIAILCFLAGGSLVFAWQKYFPTSKSTPSFSPSPISVLPSSIPSPTSQIPADWKTYNPIIKNLNFSFKYPPNWQLKENKGGEDTAIAYFYSNEIIDLEGPEDLQYYFYVTPTKGLPEVEFSKEIINGYTVYKTDKLPSRSGALSYFITNNENNYIQLSLNPYNVNQPFPKQEQNKQIFDQILSTFRFIEQNQTSDWKTYTDEDYHLTFKYPLDWKYTDTLSNNPDPNSSDKNFILESSMIRMLVTTYPLMNECMKIISSETTKIGVIDFVKTNYQGVDEGEMCAGTDMSTKSQLWITPARANFGYNFQFEYLSKDKEEAEKLINQILATFGITL